MKLSTKLITIVGLILGISYAHGATASSVRVPKKVDIFLKDAELLAAAEALTKQTGVQFLFIPSTEPFEKINLSLKGVSAEDAICYLCQAAGAWAELDPRGVYVIRKGTPPPNAIGIKEPILTRRIYVKHADTKLIYDILMDSAPTADHQRTSDSNWHDRYFESLRARNTPTQSAPESQNSSNQNNTISPAQPLEAAPKISIQPEGAHDTAPSSARNFPITGSRVTDRATFQVPKGNNFPVTGLQPGQGGLPQGITRLVYVPGQNFLLASGTQEALDELQRQVDYLDVPPKQILVKVEFIETTLNVNQNYGIDVNWTPYGCRSNTLITTIPGINTPTAVLQNAATSAGLSPNTSGQAPNPNVAAAQQTPANPPTFGFADPTGTYPSGSFGIGWQRGPFATTLRAALSEGNSKVMQAPLLRTLNGQEAVAEFSEIRTISVPAGSVPVSGVGTTQQFNSFPFNAAKKLVIRPRINGDGTITVGLRPQIQDFQAGDQVTEPNVLNIMQSKYVDLVARVDDGETIVIGGIKSNTDNFTRAKTPLSYIPIIGPWIDEILSHTIHNVADAELLIFVTLKILDENTAVGPYT